MVAFVGTLEEATAVSFESDLVVVSLGDHAPYRGDPALESALDVALEAGARWVIVDVSGIAPPSWLLLRLLRLNEALQQERQGGVLLEAVPAPSLRRLERTGVSLLFPTFGSLDEALEWAASHT
jgi:hypothetical protein